MPHFWYLVSVHKMEITTFTKWKPSVKEGFGKKKINQWQCVQLSNQKMRSP